LWDGAIIPHPRGNLSVHDRAGAGKRRREAKRDGTA